MKFIAAVDDNWAIGNKGKLLARISADQRFFKETTMGHVVVLGRKTIEEFPGGRPLPGRTNIILSTSPDYKVDGATVVHNMTELGAELAKYESDDIFIIGGESIYKQMYIYCDTAIITKIHKAFEADAFVPNLDELPNWSQISAGEVQTANELEFQFTTYTNSDIVKFE